MPEKRSKYETDPLDPDYARQTSEVWSEGPTRPVDDPGLTGQIGGETRRIDPAATPTPQPRRNPDPQYYAPDSEAPTRRIDDAVPQSYPSVFVPPPYQPPPAPQTYAPPAAHAQPPHGLHGARPFAPERNIAGLGIPERYANVAAYAPFYIGLVVSIIELLLVPRSEARTRYHAAQALGLHLAVLAVGFVLGILGGIGGVRAGAVLFSLAATAFLIYSMVKVWNGQQHRLAPLADVTRFLDERIDPRK